MYASIGSVFFLLFMAKYQPQLPILAKEDIMPYNRKHKKHLPKEQSNFLQNAIPHVLENSVNNGYLVPEDLASLSSTNRFFNLFLKKSNRSGRVRVLKQLQEAILDGDIPLIKSLLNAHPRLLLMKQEEYNEIESQLNLKKVIAEIPFAMALKTRQVEVLKVMFPYLEKIEQGHETALELWEDIEKLPVKNPYDFKSLIETISREEFPNRFYRNLKDMIHKMGTIPPNDVYGKLSEATEKALETFRNSVLPEEAIALEDDYDMLDMLDQLSSAPKASAEHFEQFTLEHFDFYFIRVFGFVQTLLQREDAAVFCHGPLDVFDRNNLPTSERATKLKLKSDDSFFHGKEPHVGLGFKFFCSTDSNPTTVAPSGNLLDELIDCMKKFKHKKNGSMASLKEFLRAKIDESQVLNNQPG